MAARPPERLTPRHEQMAMLVMQGKSNREISIIVGMHENRVATIKGSPLFIALVDNLKRTIREHEILETVDRLHSLGGIAVDALEHHATNYGEPAASVAAAKDILDRNPRTARIARTESEKTLRFVMSDETAKRIANALAEDDGRTIDAVAAQLPAGVPTRIRTLEEALAEMEE